MTIPGGEVVGAVHDQVVLGEDLQDVVVVQSLVVNHDGDVQVDLCDGVRRRLRLRTADVVWPWMICRCRFDSSTTSNSTIPRVPTPAAAKGTSAPGTQATGSSAEDLGALESFLSGHPDLRDDDVAAGSASPRPRSDRRSVLPVAEGTPATQNVGFFA